MKPSGPHRACYGTPMLDVYENYKFRFNVLSCKNYQTHVTACIDCEFQANA